MHTCYNERNVLFNKVSGPLPHPQYWSCKRYGSFCLQATLCKARLNLIGALFGLNCVEDNDWNRELSKLYIYLFLQKYYWHAILLSYFLFFRTKNFSHKHYTTKALKINYQNFMSYIWNTWKSKSIIYRYKKVPKRNLHLKSMSTHNSFQAHVFERIKALEKWDARRKSETQRTHKT